mgnify:CR=1 FL=1
MESDEHQDLRAKVDGETRQRYNPSDSIDGSISDAVMHEHNQEYTEMLTEMSSSQQRLGLYQGVDDPKHQLVGSNLTSVVNGLARLYCKVQTSYKNYKMRENLAESREEINKEAQGFKKACMELDGVIYGIEYSDGGELGGLSKEYEDICDRLGQTSRRLLKLDRNISSVESKIQTLQDEYRTVPESEKRTSRERVRRLRRARRTYKAWQLQVATDLERSREGQLSYSKMLHEYEDVLTDMTYHTVCLEGELRYQSQDWRKKIDPLIENAGKTLERLSMLAEKRKEILDQAGYSSDRALRGYGKAAARKIEINPKEKKNGDAAKSDPLIDIRTRNEQKMGDLKSLAQRITDGTEEL